jgi:hypothetical protein
MDSGLRNVQALLFDVFGTTVDWHSSLIQELATLGNKYGVGGFLVLSMRCALFSSIRVLDGNWSDLSKTWRLGYIEHMSVLLCGLPLSAKIHLIYTLHL